MERNVSEQFYTFRTNMGHLNRCHRELVFGYGDVEETLKQYHYLLKECREPYEYLKKNILECSDKLEEFEQKDLLLFFEQYEKMSNNVEFFDFVCKRMNKRN